MPDTHLTAYTIAGQMLAGLGLFFIGIKLIGANLRLMTGRGFRNFLLKLTGNPFRSGAVGVVAGGITQSTSAVTFIMTGMIAAGLVTTRRAMPLVLWSNPGNCILVFLAVINFHAFILYLIGLVGFLHYIDLDKSKIFKPIVGGLLGIGLLFLGIDFIKDGAKHLQEFDTVNNLLGYASNSYILALLVAGIVSFFAQSAATVSAIAIALADTGILGFSSALMVVYGSNLGPGIATYLIARQYKGPPKQLAMYQVSFKILALGLMVSLFFIEEYTGIPLIQALLKSTFEENDLRLAVAYLLFQVLGATAIAIISQPIASFLEKKYKESKESLLAKPQFINDDALKQPDIAMELLLLEHKRLLERLPQYFQGHIDDLPGKDLSKSYHAANKQLINELLSFSEDIIASDVSKSLIERALTQHNRVQTIKDLEFSIFEMIRVLPTEDVDSNIATFQNSILQATHLLLSTLHDHYSTDNDDSHDILLNLTEDRGDLMQRIYNDIRAAKPDLNFDEKKIFDVLSSRFERVVWMVRTLSRLKNIYVKPAEEDDQ